MGAQKNRLIETVLLSTHNICFGWEIKKIIFQYALLSGGLNYGYLFSFVAGIGSIRNIHHHLFLTKRFRREFLSKSQHIMPWSKQNYRYVHVDCVFHHGLQSLPPSPKRAERKGRRRPFREAGSGHKQFALILLIFNNTCILIQSISNLHVWYEWLRLFSHCIVCLTQNVMSLLEVYIL